MHCKSLWIKASAKCINVNVNVYHNINISDLTRLNLMATVVPLTEKYRSFLN